METIACLDLRPRISVLGKKLGFAVGEVAHALAAKMLPKYTKKLARPPCRHISLIGCNDEMKRTAQHDKAEEARKRGGDGEDRQKERENDDDPFPQPRRAPSPVSLFESRQQGRRHHWQVVNEGIGRGDDGG